MDMHVKRTSKSKACLALGAVLTLSLAACGQNVQPVAEPKTFTSAEAATSVVTTTEAAPTVTETATVETTVEPVDTEAAQSVFTTEPVRVQSQGAPELVIQDVRAGTHDGYDRVVFEYSGPGKPGFIAGYNPDPRQQTSGYPLEGLKGNAFLEVMIQGTPMMMMSQREDLLGVGPVRVAPGGGFVGAGSVQGVVHGGVFEADTQYVIGLDKVRPYNIYVLENPTRVVVDFQQ
ncbi:hypothetical protein JKI95_11310 [Corynebacterium aquatimens]|uniref:AMIN-like domain-containing (lipo)protein n=1 Tax=Corynebacterium TaxID=1716 RepID=UPI001F1975F0|nr:MULTISPECIES: hypothetical protein [Corynebacterium]QYH19586.1 hypothetical protein JKI95_11310 [Corynebacterium aquatimens]UIZ91444.1 hypothetical protein JZY91_06660 [Corynebacterium sp. CNCTC7651]